MSTRLVGVRAVRNGMRARRFAPYPNQPAHLAKVAAAPTLDDEGDPRRNRHPSNATMPRAQTSSCWPKHPAHSATPPARYLRGRPQRQERCDDPLRHQLLARAWGERRAALVVQTMATHRRRDEEGQRWAGAVLQAACDCRTDRKLCVQSAPYTLSLGQGQQLVAASARARWHGPRACRAG